MISLLNQYKTCFKEELGILGFQLYKKTFYRKINDVVQTLMLRKTNSSFTLDFSIIPLCLPIEDLYCEGYDISMLREKQKVWWEFWNENEENAFEEILSLFRLYIKSIFERGVDAKNAYAELIGYEKKVYTAIPGGVIMHNYGFVRMCIQAQDYENAYVHMAAIVKQCEDGYKLKIDEYEKRGDINGRELYNKRFEHRILELKEELHKLSMPDIEYFQNLTSQNEDITLEFLNHLNIRR